jgi:high-affinity Fe2+/Pb2+ permease
MPEFLLGVVALLLLLFAVSAFVKADPKQVARVLRWIGGGAALLFAGFLLFRGGIAVAIPPRSLWTGSARLDVALAGLFWVANTEKRGTGIACADSLP